MEENKFFVQVLGIVYDEKTKRILIAKRDNDPHVKTLTWCFPGGRITPNKDNNIEKQLIKKIKEKINIDISVKKLIFARIPKEQSDFLLMYYLCTAKTTTAQAKDGFVEIKWIKPLEIKKYFTTSIDTEIISALESL